MKEVFCLFQNQANHRRLAVVLSLLLLFPSLCRCPLSSTSAKRAVYEYRNINQLQNQSTSTANVKNCHFLYFWIKRQHTKMKASPARNKKSVTTNLKQKLMTVIKVINKTLQKYEKILVATRIKFSKWTCVFIHV